MAAPATDPNDDPVYRHTFDTSVWSTTAFAVVTLLAAAAVRVYRVTVPDADTARGRLLQLLLSIPLPYEGVLWALVAGFTLLTCLIAAPGPYPVIPVRRWGRGARGRGVRWRGSPWLRGSLIRLHLCVLARPRRRGTCRRCRTAPTWW
jgi:hypothetical protein